MKIKNTSNNKQLEYNVEVMLTYYQRLTKAEEYLIASHNIDPKVKLAFLIYFAIVKSQMIDTLIDTLNINRIDFMRKYIDDVI